MSQEHHETTSRFVKPLDVMFLRGNQLFGEPGSYGSSQMPPWPSVMAGALRTRILVDDGLDPADFARGASHPDLGTVQEPGKFILRDFCLARLSGGQASPELLMPLPADLQIMADSRPGFLPSVRKVLQLRPVALHAKIATSMPLQKHAVIARNQQAKADSGWWLRQCGWEKYLAGQTPDSGDLVHAGSLWKLDERVGIGLDAAAGSVAEGRLFTNTAIAPFPGVGFALRVAGASPAESGLLRLGGDARGAVMQVAEINWPEPDYQAISTARSCRIVLTSPGIFAQGWKLPGLGDDDRLVLPGISARLVCAAMGRSETISGWDLARARPKKACRAVSAGSVFWLEDLEADPEALRRLVMAGLWDTACQDPQRRAEGFNRFIFAPF